MRQGKRREWMDGGQENGEREKRKGWRKGTSFVERIEEEVNVEGRD